MKRAVLVGSALPSDLVAAHKMSSSAAARWQTEFAGAVASQLNVTVDCLSFLPVAIGEPPFRASKPIELSESIRVIPVVWNRRVGGTQAYCLKMIGHIAARRKTDLIFCYNPTFWTAPWAILLALFSSAPLIMIVADLAPTEGGPVARLVGRLERALLKGGSRFLLLSPATAELLPRIARAEVFPGLVDSTASAFALPTYSDKVRFVFAGALNDFGGVRTFLEAAAEIGKEFPSAEFHIFGRGNISIEIPESIEPRTVLHGFVPEHELNAFLGQDCVGVNPRPDAEGRSRYNAPYKLIHYVSRGVATITTITPGVTADIASACIVASDGVAGLVAGMRRALQLTPSERSGLGEQARNAATRNLSRAALAMHIEKLLEDSASAVRTS